MKVLRGFVGKKFVVTMCSLIFAYLATKGFDVPEELQYWLIGGVVCVVSFFNLGQGIADAGSKGKTSATFTPDKDYEAIIEKLIAERVEEGKLPQAGSGSPPE